MLFDIYHVFTVFYILKPKTRDFFSYIPYEIIIYLRSYIPIYTEAWVEGELR